MFTTKPTNTKKKKNTNNKKNYMFLFKHWSGKPFRLYFHLSFIFAACKLLRTVQLTMIYAFILQSLMTVTSH